MPGRPNILWIVTTQWRAQACGYAGDVDARTPAIDALASSSVNFTQAVTPHPFGPFARAALLTGVPSPQNGVAAYFDPLPGGARTIAHDLRDLGYETAWFGKWHLHNRDPAAPLVGEAHARVVVPEAARGGFAFWEGFESGFLLEDPWLHGTRLPEPVRFSGYQSDVLCERAAAWLQSAERSRPWFCVVSLEPPHPPYAAPASGARPIDPSTIRLAANVPCGGEVEARARRELAGYYAHIAATDRAIGALLAAAPRDAAAIFTSVHGDMHGAHGRFRKGWPHEESIRVPLLAREPFGRGAGSRSGKLVTLLDLPEMTRAWAQGGSWDCAREHAAISMPCVVDLPHQCDRVWHGMRTARRKTAFNSDGSLWLEFDLSRDPFEMNNLARPAS